MGRSIRAYAVAALGLLGFPVWATLRSGLPRGEAAVALVAAAAFAGAYAWVMVGAAPPRQGRVVDIAVAALAATATAINVAYPDGLRWGLLFAYVSLAAGLRLPARRGVISVVGVVTMALATLLWVRSSLGPELRDDLPVTGPQGLLELLLVGLGAVAVRRLIETTEELRAARAEIGRLAVERERHRFARDLHDLLGHSLSLIALKSELAGRLMPERPDAAAGEIRDIERAAREALREVREVVTGYRRMSLRVEVAAARATLEASGIACVVADAGGELPPETEAVFAWAVREGVTNVARHSGARSCEVRIARTWEGATLEIHDDGAGGSGEPGNGLRGLTERATAAGGRLDAGASALGGYRLRLTLPLPTQGSPSPPEVGVVEAEGNQR